MLFTTGKEKTGLIGHSHIAQCNSRVQEEIRAARCGRKVAINFPQDLLHSKRIQHMLKKQARTVHKIACGAQVFVCCDIKTWGTRVSSNWWLLREGGFLGRNASTVPLQCFFHCVCSLTVLFEESDGGDTAEKVL